MSLSTITTIVCDGCGGRVSGVEVKTLYRLGESFADAAQKVNIEGWKRDCATGAWLDLCPACQNKGKEENET